MTLLDKIKLIDFYLHGVDRDVQGEDAVGFWIIQRNLYPPRITDLYYHTSLDALRPVIVKLYRGKYCKGIPELMKNQIDYICGIGDFQSIFDSVVECITYLNEKKI